MTLFLSLLLTNVSFSQKRKVNLNTIEGQIQYLLLLHQKDMKSFRYSNFERAFFNDFQFMSQFQGQSFFRQVATSLKNSNRRGRIFMSYTSSRFVHGKAYSVSYTFQSNGSNAVLVKQTNNNGKLLKAIYNYDVNIKNLQINEIKNKKFLFQKEYKI